MKTNGHTAAGRRRGQRAAFTLAELLIVMVIILLVIAGAISGQMYGLRMFEFVKPKLIASEEARKALALLTEEIRSANLVRLGNGNANSFTQIAPNVAQLGSAIQIYPTTDTNRFIRYYWDATDQSLKRRTNGAGGVYTVAHSVSNRLVFSSEDFAGNVMTNNQNNRVIGLNLQFYQIQYPAAAVGPGNFYDFYQLRTKITRRTLL